MSKVRELFDKALAFQKENNRRQIETLAPPATSEDISKVEREIGVSLPSEYKDLLRIHNGYKKDAHEYHRFEIGDYYHSEWVFLSTTAVVDFWKLSNDLHEEFAGQFPVDRKNENGVKPVDWNKRWVPIFTDVEGNALCIDFDPDKGGTKGQLIYADHDRYAHRLVAPNFIEGLEILVDKLTGVSSNESISISTIMSKFPNQRNRGLMYALSTEADDPTKDDDKKPKDGDAEGGEEGKGKDDPKKGDDQTDTKPEGGDKGKDDQGEKKPDDTSKPKDDDTKPAEGEGKPEGEEGKGDDILAKTDADPKPADDANAAPAAEPAAEPAPATTPAEGTVAEGGEGTPGKNDATPQFDPDDQGPLDVAVDPDHPETIEGLSLIEYAHLFRFEGDGPTQEDTDTVLATESFAEHWQNFKNRFETRMSNDEAYIDTMMARLKEKMPSIQAANDKESSHVPISIFANVNWFQLDAGKMLNSATAIIQQLERLIELNTALETDWVPVYAKAIKGMIDILAVGANDVDSAYDRAYVMEATFATPKMEALTKHPHQVKVGSGKTVAGSRTDAYPGSWYLVKYEVPDGAEKGVKRGVDYYSEHNGAKPAGKVQLKPATREEMKKIVELSIKLCEIMDRTVELAMDAGAKMLIDKVNNFENHHRNWRKYPKEERQKIAGIINSADNVLYRSWITSDAIDGTRMPLRAFERFVDMSLSRLK